MLGDAHAPAENCRLAVDVDLRRVGDLSLRQATVALDLAPVGRMHRRAYGIEAIAVLRDERIIECSAFDHDFRNANQHGEIATDARLEIVRRNLGVCAEQHVSG